jgi:hypothetical protein
MHSQLTLILRSLCHPASRRKYTLGTARIGILVSFLRPACITDARLHPNPLIPSLSTNRLNTAPSFI